MKKIGNETPHCAMIEFQLLFHIMNSFIEKQTNKKG